MADLTKAQVKKNLADLQKRLETNPRARASFLKDPAATLGRTGLALSAERARAINTFVEKQTQMPGARVSGAAIRPSGAANEVEVVVSVGVRF